MLLAPSPPLFYISLSLSFSDFLIYHFRPHHCLVGFLSIFSSFLPLRLDRQLFMMFHCPRDFTLQIWDYSVLQVLHVLDFKLSLKEKTKAKLLQPTVCFKSCSAFDCSFCYCHYSLNANARYTIILHRSHRHFLRGECLLIII